MHLAVLMLALYNKRFPAFFWRKFDTTWAISVSKITKCMTIGMFNKSIQRVKE